MLTEPTIEKLRQLRLEAMAAGYLEQQQTPTSAELSFDERFGLLVDVEYLARENKRLARRLREAKLNVLRALRPIREDDARLHTVRARYGAGGELLFGEFGIADAYYAPVATRFLTYAVALPDAAQPHAHPRQQD